MYGRNTLVVVFWAALLTATPLLGQEAAPAPVDPAVVDSVKENSPAARAGLKAGDVVTGLEEMDHPSLEAVLAHRLAREKAGDTRLRVRRGSEDLPVRLPPGDWGFELRPVLSETVLARLGELRQALRAEETRAEGQGRWEALADQVEKEGRPGPSVWLRLELARALRDLRRWQEAGDVCRGVAEHAPESGGWRFIALLALAQALSSAGADDAASEVFTRARSLAAARDSEALLAVVLQLNGLSELRRGRLPESRELAEKVLAIWERLAPDSLAFAAGLTNLGLVSRELGDLAAAGEHFRRALAIQERLAPAGTESTTSLNGLGLVEWKRGDLAAAREHFQRALEVQERLAPGSLNLATCLNNLGLVAIDQGDLGAARRFLLRSLAIRERRAPGSRRVADSFVNLGNVAWWEGDWAAARKHYLQALAIEERLAPGSLSVADVLNNIGLVAWKHGDPAAARVYLTKALVLRERLAPGSVDVANSLNNLGAVAGDEGDFPAAKEYFLRALRIQEKLAPGGIDLARSLENLGSVALDQGDPASAVPYFLQSLKLRERLAPGGLDVARSYSDLGKARKTQGDLAAAREHHRKALEIRERLAPGSVTMADSLQQLAEVEGASGNLPRRLELLERTVDTIEAQREKTGAESAKATFSAGQGLCYTNLIAACLEANRPAQALETLERSRSRALLEMIFSRTVDLQGEIPGPLLDRRRDLARRRTFLYNRLAQADAQTDPGEIDAWRSELFMLPQQEDALAEEIRQASPRLAALEYPKPLGYSGIVNALEPGTLLIAYAVAEERTHLFALLRSRSGKASLRTATLPVGRGEIERRVRLLRSQLGLKAASRVNSEAWKKNAQSLFATLLAPAGREIAACRQILLLPDAALHLLPFSVLTPAGKQRPKGLKAEPLGLQKPLSVQPSLTVYASLKAVRPRSATPGGASWAGFGDPLYPVGGHDVGGEPVDPAGGGFPLQPLPGTKEEVLSVSALFGGPRSRVFLGPEATEGAVRAVPRGTDYLHFACHGLIDADFPMNSALALSPAPAPEPRDAASRDDHRLDGFLQAWEIIQDLRLNSGCVVLSACETGLGKVLGGEGIMGLTRAFFYAGARSVVVSFWPISDESARCFMETFYREILAGAPRDVALLRARARLIREGKYAHPFHWAAFELHGRRD